MIPPDDWKASTSPKEMQASGQARPPVGIVFDTAISRIDDALALAMLYALDGKNESRLVSVSISRPNLKAAAYVEAVGQFYAGAVSGAFGGAGRTLPAGLRIAAKPADDAPLFVQPLERKDEKGQPVYHPGIRDLNDTADPIAVMRNAFTSQYDSNSIVLLSGPATNLAHLLAQHDGKYWIERKVKLLVVALGCYPEGSPEAYAKADIAAAQKLFDEWPTPVIACGSELGDSILFPGASIEQDFAWSPAHPVADAYRAYHSMPYDAPSTAMAAALYAARSGQNYFRVSDPGKITVAPDGRTRFAPSASGKHRYLIADAGEKDRIVKAYVELASAKPVQRTPRFPRPQQQQKAPTKPDVK